VAVRPRQTPRLTAYRNHANPVHSRSRELPDSSPLRSPVPPITSSGLSHTLHHDAVPIENALAKTRHELAFVNAARRATRELDTAVNGIVGNLLAELGNRLPPLDAEGQKRPSKVVTDMPVPLGGTS
jgi:hypothetical protein